jgi:hypothetical protein
MPVFAIKDFKICNKERMLDARKIYCSIFDIPGLEYDSTDTNYQTVTLPALNL